MIDQELSSCLIQQISFLRDSLEGGKTQFSYSEIETQLSVLERVKDYIGKTESDFDSQTVADDDALLADVLNNPENLTPFAVRSLPEDLKEEISLNDTDKFEIDVLNLVDRAKNKRISINNLLIALRITTGKTYSRTILNNRLYRMVKKNILFSVPGRKGLYTTNNNVRHQVGNEDDMNLDF
ncbi:hypothetical protein [Snodgrassella alvi]|uniref:hypothetical protein n=1 Tax=Snodgrassella alvi TaxID=1196083 RepID=UPI00351A2255